MFEILRAMEMAVLSSMGTEVIYRCYCIMYVKKMHMLTPLHIVDNAELITRYTIRQSTKRRIHKDGIVSVRLLPHGANHEVLGATRHLNRLETGGNTYWPMDAFGFRGPLAEG